MKETILQLIDIMKDLNKSVSMHIDNHNQRHVDDAIQDMAFKIGNHLNELEIQLRNGGK